MRKFKIIINYTNQLPSIFGTSNEQLTIEVEEELADTIIKDLQTTSSNIWPIRLSNGVMRYCNLCNVQYVDVEEIIEE